MTAMYTEDAATVHGNMQ